MTEEFQLSYKDVKDFVAKGDIPDEFDTETAIQLKSALNQLLSQAKRRKKRGGDQKKTEEFSAKEDQMPSDESSELYQLLMENKALIKQIIGNDKTKPSKFRQSGHLTDQTLKYIDPKKNQLSLFDLISSETKEKIEATSYEIKAEGIRLTPSEDKIVKALNKLLQSKSEFYSNNDYQVAPYGGQGQEAKAPILRIYPSELYKAYLDREDYSGDDIKFIKKTLHEFSQKKFLIIYDRRRKENGKILTDRIEDFQSLIKIMSYIEGLSESELQKLNSGDTEIREKRGELIIGMNPIFIDQINNKYIEFPTDINKRTTIAAGGHFCVTESMIVLRDYMLREMSAKRYVVEINEEKLPYILHLDNYVKERKKKIISKRIADAITTVKNLGIILEVEKTIGASGQNKYIFVLNQDFE